MQYTHLPTQGKRGSLFGSQRFLRINFSRIRACIPSQEARGCVAPRIDGAGWPPPGNEVVTVWLRLHERHGRTGQVGSRSFQYVTLLTGKPASADQFTTGVPNHGILYGYQARQQLGTGAFVHGTYYYVSYADGKCPVSAYTVCHQFENVGAEKQPRCYGGKSLRN